MTTTPKTKAGAGQEAPSSGCCRIVSFVSVDDRGQMVLPKEIRERARINPGDKLAVVSWEKDGDVCCITLIKSDNFESMVRSFLSPMMKDLTQD